MPPPNSPIDVPLRKFAPPEATGALTLDELVKLWEQSDSLKLHYAFDASMVPPAVNIDKLCFRRKVHDQTVLEVFFNDDNIPRKSYIYKTVRQFSTYRFLYHELRNLLIKAPHKHVIPAPTHIVFANSKRDRGYRSPFAVSKAPGDGEEPPEEIICGFLLPTIPGLNLDQAVKRKSADGTLTLGLKLKWCRQLAEALHHVYHHGYGSKRPSFYSELKPNNILITKDGEDVVLLDFEQATSWKEYSAPEVWNYKSHHDRRGYQIEKTWYDGAVFGYEEFFSSQKPPRKVLATVYSLGIVMYAIMSDKGCVEAEINAGWRKKKSMREICTAVIEKSNFWHLKLQQLVHRMVRRMPKKRITLGKVVDTLRVLEGKVVKHEQPDDDLEAPPNSPNRDSPRATSPSRYKTLIDLPEVSEDGLFRKSYNATELRWNLLGYGDVMQWLPFDWKNSEQSITAAMVRKRRLARACTRKQLRLTRRYRPKRQIVHQPLPQPVTQVASTGNEDKIYSGLGTTLADWLRYRDEQRCFG